MLYISDKLRTEFEKARRAIINANKICIISHRSPDGDAIGTNLALKYYLESLGKEVVSACVDEPPTNSLFLKDCEKFVLDFDEEQTDLFISVDCGDKKLVKFHEKKPNLFSGEKIFINFDHHESNNNFGTINPVDQYAPATAMIMYKFLKFCEAPITVDTATCLLHGIYFDTGSLMHSNTSAETYEVAGELLAKGADVRQISKELFHTTPVNRLRLWGKIMERAYVNEEGVVVSAVSKSDYAMHSVDSKDTAGVIDYLNSVPEGKYCVLLSEDENGLVKGSLRTHRNDINLSEVASKWGGGGHPKASGFGIEGKLVPVMTWKIASKDGEGEAHEVEF